MEMNIQMKRTASAKAEKQEPATLVCGKNSRVIGAEGRETERLVSDEEEAKSQGL